jgi:hypothetical protein
MGSFGVEEIKNRGQGSFSMEDFKAWVIRYGEDQSGGGIWWQTVKKGGHGAKFSQAE